MAEAGAILLLGLALAVPVAMLYYIERMHKLLRQLTQALLEERKR